MDGVTAALGEHIMRSVTARSAASIGAQTLLLALNEAVLRRATSALLAAEDGEGFGL